MIKARKIGVFIFFIVFALMAKIIIGNKTYLTLPSFSLVFIIGLLSIRKKYFWKYFFTFFGIMSAGSVFTLFGGLEPDTPGLIAAGRYFDIEMLMVILYVASAAFSFVAGRREEKMEKSNAEEKS